MKCCTFRSVKVKHSVLLIKVHHFFGPWHFYHPTETIFDHYFYCDNTVPFLVMGLIKRLVISNLSNSSPFCFKLHIGEIEWIITWTTFKENVSYKKYGFSQLIHLLQWTAQRQILVWWSNNLNLSSVSFYHNLNSIGWLEMNLSFF